MANNEAAAKPIPLMDQIEAAARSVKDEELEPIGPQVILSIAISLKRIADALEGMADPNRPVSAYGEGLAEAIQNSIARGLAGISVPR